MDTNANDAYRAAQDRVDKALNQINRHVREHGARQFRDNKNWGHAGDMNHVVELLNDAIEFLGGEKVA